MQSIISSMGEKEIEALKKDEMSKTKQKLQNYVEIAYNIVESNFENSQSKKWLQKEYGLELNKIIDISESLVREHIKLVAKGRMSIEEAKKNVLHSISQLRYNEDTGYVWINEIGTSISKILTSSEITDISSNGHSDKGMGYVWVNDIGKPYPRMLMHPTIPSLNGKVLDDERFNCALGIRKNLFVAMVDVAGKYGEGFVDYVWPKPTKDGLSKEQPKLSYVRLIPEWNWIVGTGIYVDDALDKAIEKSVQDLKKMRYNGGEGYFWINDRSAPYPTMIMHPTMPELDGKVMDDQRFNVAHGEHKHLFKAILKQAEKGESGFVTYMWPKPTKEGLTEDQPKLSYVLAFEPFNWIIGTGIYIDSIDLLIAEKVKNITSTNYYLLLTILSVAVALFLLLTTASYYLVDRFFIRNINIINDDLQLEIEERKKTEKKLIIARKNSEVANSAKSEFLANMSHEIRTPMNAVIGLAQLLLQTQLTMQQEDYLQKVIISADNLLHIIDDILDFSKIEAGMLKLETIPFNLGTDVLENVSQVVGVTAMDKGLEVMFDLDPKLPQFLLGDPVRLQQILINLMNNAVKFTEKGEITLRISIVEIGKNDCLLRFEIADTGIGMTDKQLSGLFLAFTQADATTTRRFGGTGLGLTISKTLVEMMDGDIGAKSHHGEGSTFWFTAKILVNTHVELPQDQTLNTALQNLKILVVDNNETARMILRRQLEGLGFQVVEAEGGERALELLLESVQDDAFDLAIIDWKMPGMDGLETARSIQIHEALGPITKVIMLTAFNNQEMQRLAKEVVINEILIKPTFPSSLLKVIYSTFGQTAEVPDRYDSEKLPDHVLGARILIVEDNIINQQVARELLENAGVIVSIAEDGEQGIAEIRQGFESGNPFDAVLMDIQMPVMDGYTATREIRKIPEFASLPIIAMTANALVSDREKALKIGMNDHVAKPINVQGLFRVLGEWVAKNKRQEPMDPIEEDLEYDLEQETFVDLPHEIPGLNLELGLKRLVGNRGLYKSMLQEVAMTYGEEADVVQQAIEAGDYDLAHNRLHTFKGAAGNIGAEQIYEAIVQLEDALLRKDEGQTITSMLFFSDELSRLMKGLEIICEDERPKSQ